MAREWFQGPAATDSPTVTVRVMHYSGGGFDPTAEGYRQTLGEIEIRASLWRLYAEQRHPGYQWPEGIARAVSCLTPTQIDRLGIDPNMIVWLDD